MTDEVEVHLARVLRLQGLGCAGLGSPLWAAMCERMAEDVEGDGATLRLLASHAGAPLNHAYPLRVLGGAHRLALAGDAPALAARLPSTGGDADVEGTWAALHDLIADPPPSLLDVLTRPPQTNEVGRSASLIGGFLVVADGTHQPVRALEIGASAGLNLRFDRYRYEQDGAGFGPRDSTVRFNDLWMKAQPPFDAPLTVAERRGCDVEPVDITTVDGRLTLLSYVWPDQHERFERMAAALDIAGRTPAAIDRADAVLWLSEQLASRAGGVTTVVFHSVMWQYLSGETQAAVCGVIEDAGSRAVDAAPLAWLRLEPENDLAFPRLRLTTWPGGADRLLAHCTYHAGPVDWLA